MKKVGRTTRPFRYDLNRIPNDYTVEVRNRFEGLDLTDRVPDELWMEVRDTVQETGIKNIPMEKKCKKAKWLPEEALQIAVKRREVKSSSCMGGGNGNPLHNNFSCLENPRDGGAWWAAVCGVTQSRTRLK